MVKRYPICRSLFLYLLGILCVYYSHILLSLDYLAWFAAITEKKNRLFIYLLANHAFGGVAMAVTGFVLLFYLAYTAASKLLYHRHIIPRLRMLILFWIFLLFASLIYHSIFLYQISISLLFFSISIFFFFLIARYLIFP
ncbi:hypothetical protein HNQ80_003202 [Anaerosolibacter carboniphilus]|uniref:Uncharacterized protein n=1 Tax=Anaerosolibacter carboniphilus TaxID=1417629 RepID=A0A841KU27_9FIRM|nr:hypothetical protein [Anaerosolibacter carboniphilus]